MEEQNTVLACEAEEWEVCSDSVAGFSEMTCLAHLGDVTVRLANKRLKIMHWGLSC